MTDRPILFSASMIRAIMEGRKTQTRRLAKFKPRDGVNLGFSGLEPDQYLPGRWNLCARGAGGCWNVRSSDIQTAVVGDILVPAMTIPSLGSRYCADLYGNIWSRARSGSIWRKMSPSVMSRGYLTVTPAIGKTYPTKFVHRLVAETYYGNAPSNSHQVRHLDGDRMNNAPCNLDWGTQEDNWSDRLVHGKALGEAHHSAKLSDNDVELIRSSALSQRALAAKFGVSQSSIWSIRANKSRRTDTVAFGPNCQRWTSRITLTVTNVRVQRLQEISEADAAAEGVDAVSMADVPRQASWNRRHDFSRLWDSINGKREGASWAANPWVVAITFDPVFRNIDQMHKMGTLSA